MRGIGPEDRRGVKRRLPAVVVMEAAAADVPIFSEFAAQTYARNMVEVRGRVEGYIDQWLFRPGAEVTAGQVLYVLDLRPYEAAVAAGQRQPAAERSRPGVRAKAGLAAAGAGQPGLRRRPTW